MKGYVSIIIYLGPQTILLLKAHKRLVETRRLEHPLLKAPLTLCFPLLRRVIRLNVPLLLIVGRLKHYITLTFTYHFEVPNDTVEFAYFIPYSYSRLLKFLPTLKNCKILPALKSLSGLAIPVLEVTDEET
jgi:hypothetical protein